jgi:hypothetical protein
MSKWKARVIAWMTTTAPMLALLALKSTGKKW